jgi:hypothetical protein
MEIKRGLPIVARCFSILLPTVTLLAFGVCCYPQTAHRIIDLHIRACGGSRALSKIHTRILEGELIRPRDGKNGFYTMIAMTPNLYFSEITIGDEHYSEGFNGKSAWRRDASGGLTTLTGDEATLLESIALYRNSPLSKNDTKNHLQSRTTKDWVQGRPALGVELTSQSRTVKRILFDAQSYLIVYEKIEVGPKSEETSYGDYHLVDGLMEPARLDFKRGGETLLISNIHVHHNRPVERAIFDFPVPSKERPPEITQLLTDISKDQGAIEAILENCTYRKTEEETEIDNQGGTIPHIREYEVFYVGGKEIQRLVSKEGKVLNSADQQREDERTKRLVVEYERAARNGGGHLRDANNEEDELHISTFLRACKFANARRERFRGQEVIVFDIQPNPAYRPQNTNERLAQKLERVMWVDGRAHQVVRLGARLADSAKMGGDC